MKKKCTPQHHHSKNCMCDGIQNIPNILALWFIRDGVEYRIVNVCFSEFSDGTFKWYVHFKHPGVIGHHEGVRKGCTMRMGVGAWRYNVRANRSDLFSEGVK